MIKTRIDWDKHVTWNEVLYPMTQIGEDCYESGAVVLLCHFLTKYGLKAACTICYELDRFGVYATDIVKLYKSAVPSGTTNEEDIQAFFIDVLIPMQNNSITREEVLERIK